MSAFDWAGLARAATAKGLRPKEFWALSPAELILILGGGAGAPALTRARLEALAAAFPDHVSEESNDG